MKPKHKKNKPARTQEQQIELGIRLMSHALLKHYRNKAKQLEAEPFALIADDIRMVRLSTFIKCYTQGNMDALVLAGDPTEAQLANAWQSLKLQYYDASGNGAALQAGERQKLLNAYILFINRVRLNMQALATHYHAGIVAELREDGFDYPLTPATLQDDLQYISNELVGWEVKKEQLEKELQEDAGRGNSNTAITEDYFLEQLAELRKFEGYNTPVTRLADEMTVYDYCISLKRYNAHAERLLNQKQLEEYAHR